LCSPCVRALRLVVTYVSPEDPWTSPAQEMTILQRSLLPSLACLAPPNPAPRGWVAGRLPGPGTGLTGMGVVFPLGALLPPSPFNHSLMLTGPTLWSPFRGPNGDGDAPVGQHVLLLSLADPTPMVRVTPDRDSMFLTSSFSLLQPTPAPTARGTPEVETQ